MENSFQLDPALMERTTSPSAISKVVTIAEPDSMSHTSQSMSMVGEDAARNSPSQPVKQHRVCGARRLSGRPSHHTSMPSLHSQSSHILDHTSDTTILEANASEAVKQRPHGHSHHQAPSQLVSQILNWFHEEKAKRHHKLRSKVRRHTTHLKESSLETIHDNDLAKSFREQNRQDSDTSDDGLALEKLEQILLENMVLDQENHRTSSKEHRDSYFPRKRPSYRSKKSSFAVSSDTEYQDGDAIVPSTDVFLDNSKTVSYSGGTMNAEVDLSMSKKCAAKEKEWCLVFKSEIVRLAHTLRLKGWRRVPLDRGEDIEVERLCGALTNAVYVVSPPKNLPQTPTVRDNSSVTPTPTRPPPKLLLRVYGPQAEHLIDREKELQILRRLARQKIGPRLLGTFINGRFEEFFQAQTLTAHDLRIPETSTQIAKRMRELHDGIELLDEERDAGPFVWRNWDKWVGRCQDVITWVDNQILSCKELLIGNPTDEWKRRGLVCGVEWSLFRKTVERYREWLVQQYEGKSGLRQQLVFAHNDTQYGNLLRIEPSGESPLLLPSNSHKQLVVIDFEYASANVPGLEFANHFTEWCYDYHSPTDSYILNSSAYPTPAEQHRFLKAYVQHRPQNHSNSTATPGATPSTPGPSSAIACFMLDSRAPGACQYLEEERKREEETEKQIQHLMREARLWRVANSAQWVAWGIVQAKVEGMDECLEGQKARREDNHDDVTPITNSKDSDPAAAVSSSSSSDPSTLNPPLTPTPLSEPKREDASKENNEEEEEEEEEFDYLGYAQERAMFFWGDVLELGLVAREDLPEELLRKVKVVGY